MSCCVFCYAYAYLSRALLVLFGVSLRYAPIFIVPRRSKADRSMKSDHVLTPALVESEEQEKEFQSLIAKQGGECTDVSCLVVLPTADLAPQFWKQKYEKDARKNWDVFYKK